MDILSRVLISSNDGDQLIFHTTLGAQKLTGCICGLYGWEWWHFWLLNVDKLLGQHDQNPRPYQEPSYTTTNSL